MHASSSPTSVTPARDPLALDAEARSWVERTRDSMSVEEKVAQLFILYSREDSGGKAQAEHAATGATLARYGRNMRPFRGTAADGRPAHQPLFHYPYADWRPALDMMAQTAPIDPHLGHALEFLNPADGGPVRPTIAAHVRLLPTGFETRGRRSTDGTVFVVVEGRGNASVEGRDLPLAPRDVFVVPSWHELRLRVDSDLVLFGYSDRAAQEKLHLFKENRS